ncbi:MAG: hypothetical protein K6G11_00305 [Lachnospiraceae bacterium]|nr:hypothetical protein [Lachnospiraceae bacterium]
MNLILIPIYIMVIITMVVGVTIVFLKGNHAAYNNIYMLFSTMIILWSTSQIMILESTDTSELWISYVVGNTGICFTGPLWLCFALLYSGHKYRKLMILPIIVGLANYLLTLTNPLTHLYYKIFEYGNVTHGPAFLFNITSTYIFMLIGSIILFIYMGKAENKGADGRTPQLMIFLAAIFPLILNLLYLVGIVKSEHDVTPVGFAISSILLLLATIRYRFLEVDLKRELEITNVQLLLEKERNRIAQQVHDTAGHTLTMLQSYMKLADTELAAGNTSEAHDLLTEGRNLTAKGIKEIRESINELRREAEYELVTQGLVQLKNTSHELPIDLSIQGTDSEKYSHLSRIIYDTVRESITNTMKYAKATKIDIFLNFQENALDVIIGDDGIGTDEIVENNGTRGIRERIEKAGGSVRFISASGEGFMTRIHIPV